MLEGNYICMINPIKRCASTISTMLLQTPRVSHLKTGSPMITIQFSKQLCSLSCVQWPHECVHHKDAQNRDLQEMKRGLEAQSKFCSATCKRCFNLDILCAIWSSSSHVLAIRSIHSVWNLAQPCLQISLCLHRTRLIKVMQVQLPTSPLKSRSDHDGAEAQTVFFTAMTRPGEDAPRWIIPAPMLNCIRSVLNTEPHESQTTKKNEKEGRTCTQGTIWWAPSHRVLEVLRSVLGTKILIQMI